jgi:exopolyphosphatase/guanosine-5'-triphosphate,3'-diphosphate pyrophosphatase
MARYAAVDIGSNSVRLEVAEVIGSGPARILASERQVTRLGASVFHSGRVSPDAMELLCTILGSMAAVWKRYDVLSIRAVATAAVREARNQGEFLARSSTALGTEVEIISGQEEARLIHLGVQSRWPHPKERFLIIDIGGGSAEIILSDDDRVCAAYSKPLGAIRLQELFLRSDPPAAGELLQMDEYIAERIAPAVREIGRKRIDRVVGTSSTAAAVVSAVSRIPRARREEANGRRASAAQMRRLYKALCAVDLKRRQKTVGIGPRRAEIIVPGMAVLLHVLDAFHMPSLFYSAAGVRDGIIADLAARGAGREQSRLTNEQRAMVEGMTERYAVPLRHAQKVARLANELFHDLQSLHQLSAPLGRLLEASAYLHDVGHYVSDTRHHKHSWYLVSNSDMPGFNLTERGIIANLCRYHRKNVPAPEHDSFQSLSVEDRHAVSVLTPLLRLADSLDRGNAQRVRSVECSVNEREVVVSLHAPPSAGIELEMWAAARLDTLFRQTYGRKLIVQRAAEVSGASR